MQSVALKGFHLSLQQNRLWSWQQEGQTCWSQCRVMVEGALDDALLQRALREVVRRHAILRTRFKRVSGLEVPVQVVREQVEVNCPVIDLSGLGERQHQQCVQQMWAEQQQEPPREEGLCSGLLRLQEEQQIWQIRVPTLCADTRSLGLLVREVAQCYAARVAGREEEEEEVLQYADVSAWQESLWQEEEAAGHEAYWQRRAGEVEPPGEEVQWLQGGSRGEVGAWQWQEVELEADVQAGLPAQAQRWGVSEEAVLVAWWQVLLWRLSRQQSRVVGVTCDGRPYQELERALGLYSRVVPLQVRVSSSLAVRQLVQHVAHE